MAPSRKPEPKGPDWPPQKTLPILRRQLEYLQKLKARTFRDAQQDEDAWKQFTHSVLIHGFGEGSQNVSSFLWAVNAGEHSLMGISEYQQQDNFRQRGEKYEATLNSSIRELEAMLPEPGIQGVYEPGDDFAFYKDLKGILAAAAKDVFIVDNYLNTEFFELYVHPIRPGVTVRVMTDQVRGNLQAVASKYASRGNFELKSSADVHDRHVFVDGRGWMIGQSIKDAAKKKPTVMVEIATSNVPTLQKIYEDVWRRGGTVVKS
jgi:hypothetical protein